MKRYLLATGLLLTLCCGSYPGNISIDGISLWMPTPQGVVSSVDGTEDAVDQWSCLSIGEGRISVAVGYADGHAGNAEIVFDSDTGEIISCDIEVSSDVAYHRDTVVRIIRHELGHCLGLADDPGVESIMADPPGWILRPEDQGACDDQQRRH